jgi:hypothetical protein
MQAATGRSTDTPTQGAGGGRRFRHDGMRRQRATATERCIVSENRQENVRGLRHATDVASTDEADVPADVRDSWNAPEKTWNRPTGGGETFLDVPDENPDPVMGRQRQHDRPEHEYPAESGERPSDA